MQLHHLNKNTGQQVNDAMEKPVNVQHNNNYTQQHATVGMQQKQVYEKLWPTDVQRFNNVPVAV